MKGLDLSREYYERYGIPMIRDGFGSYENRIAAGCVGPGSECFGFDDEISRDHDWGPGFCLWLTVEDYAQIGRDLQEAYNRLPPEFKGFGQRIVSPGEERRVGVSDLRSFYLQYTGIDRAPASNSEWLRISEQALGTCTNGAVFSDRLGVFSEWRERILQFYPEDVRLKKIASRCFTAAQAGQYNFSRSIKRKEYFAARYSEIKFCADTISLVFLLNKKYTPFYKWMHRGVRDLPILGEAVARTIDDLTRETSKEEQEKRIEEISGLLIAELRREGLSSSSSDFLLEHAFSVHSLIRDERLRERFWVVA
jgi:hypothetical protein